MMAYLPKIQETLDGAGASCGTNMRLPCSSLSSSSSESTEQDNSVLAKDKGIGSSSMDRGKNMSNPGHQKILQKAFMIIEICGFFIFISVIALKLVATFRKIERDDALRERRACAYYGNRPSKGRKRLGKQFWEKSTSSQKNRGYRDPLRRSSLPNDAAGYSTFSLTSIPVFPSKTSLPSKKIIISRFLRQLNNDDLVSSSDTDEDRLVAEQQQSSSSSYRTTKTANHHRHQQQQEEDGQ